MTHDLPIPVTRLDIRVVDCHLYDMGAFELQIEDTSIGLDIRLRFPSEPAKDWFLADAAAVRRDA